jgi:serine/threonine protein phosphatase 1
MALSRLARIFSGDRPVAASLPEGLRVYAIGDIHGRLDLLSDLAHQIDDDLQTASGIAITIFLGDYVDRGPNSAGVIECLARGNFPTEFMALRGNHEDVMLKFLDDSSVLSSWRNFGGLETLHSYGVDVGPAMRGVGYESLRLDLLERMPEWHRQFLDATVLSASFGDYFFCHAGARPGVPLEQQEARDLLWIRNEFLDFQGNWDKVVVHGHTPVAEPDTQPNRINIDTGAFASSVLTAIVLEGSRRRFLSTRPRIERRDFDDVSSSRKRSA